MPPAIVSCACCGKDAVKMAFEMRKSEARGLVNHYCSPECWARGENERRFGLRLCAECGAPAPKSAEHGTSDRPLCSKACVQAGRERRTRERIEAQTSQCPICMELFHSKPMGRKQVRKAHCSKRCAEVAHSTRMSGRGNPKWKNGATERRQKHGAKAFRTQRLLALERDGHRCVVCQVSDRRLEVHHIDNEPTHNSLSNLVTLCSAHHRQWHAAMDRRPSSILWPWLSAYAARPPSTISKSTGRPIFLPTAS